MIIKSIRARNFRCILNATLECEALTASVGPNGSGKSTFLRALELFYAPRPNFGVEDYYNRDTANPIEIAVTYTDLDEEAKEQFAGYITGDTFTVTRFLSLTDGTPHTSLHGERLQNPDFSPVRDAPSAREATRVYTEIRDTPDYGNLPRVRSQTAALEALTEWEREHPEQCKRMADSGHFFGFTEVGQGYLGRFTQFIPVPDVRDAAVDAAEGRRSPITEIMDLVVRSSLANRKEFQVLREDTQRRYDEIVSPEKLSELNELEARLTATLRTYAPDAKVLLSWFPADEISMPMPRTNVRLDEDGYPASVGSSGHGLQRAFILTMLQHLAVSQPTNSVMAAPEESNRDDDNNEQHSPISALPDLVLARIHRRTPMDGVRTAEGGVGEGATGEMAWGLGVDGRPADGSVAAQGP